MSPPYTTIEINKSKPIKSQYQSLKKQPYPIIKMAQCHGTHIHHIQGYPSTAISTLPQTDGLITQLPKLFLAVKHADCMPIIIWHPEPLLCVLHAGRKGTEKKILQKALQQIKTISHSSQGFYIWMGPHICESCYEINPETKKHYSLLKENQSQLNQELSLKANTLVQSNDCTSCSNNYFSYRKNHKTKKRNFSLCAL